MSAILILGESGSGKTASLRKLSPASTLLIQIIKKDLPFKNDKWKPLTKNDAGAVTGNILVSRNTKHILGILKQASELGFKNIVIDDLQYLMSYELFERREELSFKKFVDIAVNVKDLFDAARELGGVNTYFLAHTESTDDGFTRMKTSGKMLRQQLTPEGLFTIVLKAVIRDDKHCFSTKNDHDTVKTPIGMFDSDLIDNDLAFVDKTIRAYY